MAGVVFILGAGASKEAGAPLMLEFLDVAHDLWKTGKVSSEDVSFSTVFKGLSALQRVHSKSQLDIQNVESVFAAFEMARTLNILGDYSPEDIEKLNAAMKTVIVSTIEQTLSIPVSGKRITAPYPYGDFIDLLTYLRGSRKLKQDVAIITFNYDMALDFTFHMTNRSLDYGLNKNTDSSAISLLKLHGSINWAQCSKCGTVIPWNLSDYFKKYEWRLWAEPKSVILGIGSHIGEFQHCDQNALSEAVVVPPTWNKSEYHKLLSSVWAKAAHELQEAENIFVVGYSLPPSDAFFRYLYALGTVGDKILKRFWVFNPDTSGEIRSRFKELLGPGAQQRFRYFQNSFGESIDILKKLFEYKEE